MLLDVEVTLNNRALCYMEDDIQLPVLTPSAMMFGRPKLIPDEHLDDEDPDMRKRARYLRRCKQVLWSRWSGEYLKSLRERQNLKHKTKDMSCLSRAQSETEENGTSELSPSSLKEEMGLLELSG